jgi:hypothetical protein
LFFVSIVAKKFYGLSPLIYRRIRVIVRDVSRCMPEQISPDGFVYFQRFEFAVEAMP